MREVVQGFRALGHEVHLLIMGGIEWEVSESLPDTNNHLLKRTLKKVIPSILWETLKDFQLIQFDKNAKNTLKQKVKELQPDLIYERANIFQTSGVEIANEHNILHFYEFNTPYVEFRKEYGLESLLTSRAHKTEEKQVTLSKKIFPVSSALKEFYRKKYPLFDDKFFVIPNAINPQKIENTTINTASTESDFIIGFVGSVSPWHGVENLILAFSSFIKKFPDSKLLIVGDGESLEELKKLAEKQGITDKVIFTGNLSHEEVFPLIKKFNVAVMAKSNWFGSPVKIFEYGAMGIPVIAPNVGPVRDVMVHKIDGFLIDQTVEDLIKALFEMKKNPEFAKRIGENFQKKILKEHTWIDNIKKIELIFQAFRQENKDA